MAGKRDREGYVEIDHRDSPGITADQAANFGFDTVAVQRGKVFKSPTFNCSHCKAEVILNPNRSRSRGYCRKCDHDICDRCSLMMKLGHPCQPFSLIAEGLDHFLLHPPLKGLQNGS